METALPTLLMLGVVLRAVPVPRTGASKCDGREGTSHEGATAAAAARLTPVGAGSSSSSCFSPLALEVLLKGNMRCSQRLRPPVWRSRGGPVDAVTDLPKRLLSSALSSPGALYKLMFNLQTYHNPADASVLAKLPSARSGHLRWRRPAKAIGSSHIPGAWPRAHLSIGAFMPAS